MPSPMQTLVQLLSFSRHPCENHNAENPAAGHFWDEQEVDGLCKCVSILKLTKISEGYCNLQAVVDGANEDLNCYGQQCNMLSDDLGSDLN